MRMKNSRDNRDIRVIRTQSALLAALAELIETNKLSCITITELCSKAQINRNTFYYHYNNIFELLNEHKELIIESINQISESRTIQNKQNLADIFNCLKSHPYFLSILNNPNCDMDFTTDIFIAASKKARLFIAINKRELNTKEKYLFDYCNAGCDAVISSWIKTGMKESAEEMAEIIWDASQKGIFTLILKEDL